MLSIEISSGIFFEMFGQMSAGILPLEKDQVNFRPIEGLLGFCLDKYTDTLEQANGLRRRIVLDALAIYVSWAPLAMKSCAGPGVQSSSRSKQK